MTSVVPEGANLPKAVSKGISTAVGKAPDSEMPSYALTEDPGIEVSALRTTDSVTVRALQRMPRPAGTSIPAMECQCADARACQCNVGRCSRETERQWRQSEERRTAAKGPSSSPDWWARRPHPSAAHRPLTMHPGHNGLG